MITRYCVLIFSLLLCPPFVHAQQPNQKPESERIKEAVNKVFAREYGTIVFYESSTAKHPLRPGDQFTRFTIALVPPNQPRYYRLIDGMRSRNPEAPENLEFTHQVSKPFTPAPERPPYLFFRFRLLWQKMQVPFQRN